MSNVLEVKNLQVSFKTYGGVVQAVRGVDFTVQKGKTVAIVGESGCGKSVTAKSIMQLLPKPPAEYKEGQILFNGENLLEKTERDMQNIRGNEIGMIFQDPMTSLNPTTKVGKQIAEGILKHTKATKKEAHQQAIDLLGMVGIPQPERRVEQYPHEFSGGMRQRAMIAISLACQPKLLIADEPTTALDVTIQAQILNLMKDLQKRTGTSIILITHDLAVVAETCDEVVVMYAGQVVEAGKVDEIFESPQHPYTQGLLKSVPSLEQNRKEPLKPIIGSPPDLMNPEPGCPFFARCDYAMEVCRHHDPDLEVRGGTHKSACWLHHPLAKAGNE
ncbi:peptide ABC transporter ATP-binding protein [Pontibacillus halophilus JSM 076056 = DSM 19796]|uniref:Peptide ABC transporter ATP-binding protein n=1 Tax=Pontibacillus halophilus JSM 076056 = DSM 19796 TaxID=1385510 RepID=A0A0A5GM68_9BACI|nr:ABC transporter ATP-binding protein [Pontibacillus halophilus]KGX92328.1 peptide ABC transporter ATP-binding protein [Pontibacillus halophilus JSM 076056 = DSM 19796]